MELRTAALGFGEAARAFAEDWRGSTPLQAFDPKSLVPDTRAAFAAAALAAGTVLHDTPARALAGSTLVLSLVTADAALDAARACAPLIAPGALWCDMNSVAPATKHAAAGAIEAAGGRYVDVAVMSPVLPARRAAPLLLSGPHAAEASAALAAIGFSAIRVVDGPVGKASSIKMIRSVMVKGIEALSAEMILAAHAAGVADEVIASLDASAAPAGWAARADYNLDRMLVHGLRRAAEMEEVVRTLADLGTGSAMTRGTVERQRAIGAIGLSPPRATLGDKVDAILRHIRKDAA